MQKIITIIDSINDRLGRSFAWLTLLMVLVVGLIVVLRYVFAIGSIALQESVMYLNALVITLGAAYTLKEQGHVRVDVFYNRCSLRTQAMIDLAGSILLLAVSCGFILWASWDYVGVSWRIREGSAESSGLPVVFLLKTCLLLLPSLLLLQGLSQALKALSLLGRKGQDS
jgi:TRAP-type mannitol/chloroaromatic compound transport system permease small subunit